jgi:hypothetical protein
VNKKLIPWNHKLGKKNNWSTVDMVEWEYFNCTKDAYFMANLGNGKVVRIVVPQEHISLIAAVMEHNYGIKPLSKLSFMRKKR